MTGQTAQPIKEIYVSQIPSILPGENLYAVTVQSVTVTKYVNIYYEKLINIILLLLGFLYCQYEQSSKLVETSLVKTPMGTIVTLDTDIGEINVCCK